MKQLNKTNVALLVAGVVLLNSGFIIKRYMSISDATDGFIKGLSIGLLVLSLLVFLRQKRHTAQL
ncbi:hypothetical protein [Flavisolibacter ginsengisoli]|uniref:Uncharacterized protein n=1 Tax=Flavisolibacter ginsengisoli DSM 18119 TaxID=1121884 RepID=A0A1M5G5W7_9BACT|nr:hypothetical protein [Flavisolibacter ginsengisoli]SHF99116.1 hypothetical protein SAMN02745131_04053 [Flavisolibacter ginsengisoli DSM 18119]